MWGSQELREHRIRRYKGDTVKRLNVGDRMDQDVLSWFGHVERMRSRLVSMHVPVLLKQAVQLEFGRARGHKMSFLTV